MTKHQCPVCGVWLRGAGFISHMKKHVREGEAKEVREKEWWDRIYHEREIVSYQKV